MYYAWLSYYGKSQLQANAIIVNGSQCPLIEIDGKSYSMDIKAKPSSAFPVLVCTRAIPDKTTTLKIQNINLPKKVFPIRRIAILGDSGCRLREKKGKQIYQACNDINAWPFSKIAQAVANWHPDLIIHAGDYYYREKQCPTGNKGCEGSPYGDNWSAWQADFFKPAHPMLTSAPLVFVRGDQEDCSKGGEGWFRLLASGNYSGCYDYSLPYFVTILPELTLAVLDVTMSDRYKINEVPQDVVKHYQQDYDSLNPKQNLWIAQHVPLWSIAPPEGLPNGAQENTTITTPSSIAAGHLPGLVKLIIAGDIHTFHAMSFKNNLPAELIAGTGGAILATQKIYPTPNVNMKDVAQNLNLTKPGFITMEYQGNSWKVDFRNPDGLVSVSCTLKNNQLICNNLK